MKTKTPSRYWARDEIASLDAALDHERIAHLSADVRFGNELLLGALYTVTFAKQMAVPSIAQIVHRGGRSPIMQTTRKRNDDTLVFFGEFFAHGHSTARGREAIERLNTIHSAYPITNDDSLYTLGTILLEGERTPRQFGLEPITEKEKQALFHFWRGVGERMEITDIPDTYAAFEQFVDDYERKHWAFTPAGQAVTNAVLRDYVRRFVPARLERAALAAITAVLPPELRAVHRLPEPSPMTRHAVGVAVKTYFTALRVLPDPPDRSVVPKFTGEYGGGGCPHLADVGPQLNSSQAPNRARG